MRAAISCPAVLWIFLSWNVRDALTDCRGQDVMAIADVLMKLAGWEELAGWLNIETNAINAICNRDNQPAQCGRRGLVQAYCDETGKPAQEVAEDLARVIEKSMKNKNVANKLRQLKLESKSDGDEPEETTPGHSRPTRSTETTGPGTHSSTDNSRTTILLVLSSLVLGLLVIILCFGALWLRPSQSKPNGSRKPPITRSSNPRSPPTDRNMPLPNLQSSNLNEIIVYLHPLDTADIFNLGLNLGISKTRLSKMKNSETFLSEMIDAWLRRVDNVISNGEPTWARLAEGLKSPVLGQEGIADQILQDHS